MLHHKFCLQRTLLDLNSLAKYLSKPNSNLGPLSVKKLIVFCVNVVKKVEIYGAIRDSSLWERLQGAIINTRHSYLAGSPHLNNALHQHECKHSGNWPVYVGGGERDPGATLSPIIYYFVSKTCHDDGAAKYRQHYLYTSEQWPLNSGELLHMGLVAYDPAIQSCSTNLLWKAGTIEAMSH